MSGVRERDGDVAGTTVRFLRPFAGGGRSGRAWVAFAAAGVAVVLMVGIGWWTSGGDRDGAADIAAPEAGPAAGSGASALSTPDPAGSDGPDGERSGSDGQGGESDGADGSGDNPVPGNRAPVIEDPGLTSDGLLLRFAPAVTDPDGDDVTLLFQVFGATVDPARVCFSDPLCKGDELPDGRRASFRFDADQVGYRREAEVTVIAIDDRGTATRQTFTHTVEAVSKVTISNVRFQLARPADCFRDVDERTMEGLIQLTGPVSVSSPFSVNVSRSRSSFDLLVGGIREVVGEEPVQTVRILVEFAGGTAAFRKSHRGNANQGLALYGSSNPCAGHFTYTVTFDVR
jgi:hypothetical protein